MRAIGILTVFIVGLVAGVLAVLLVDVEQTREARLPVIEFQGGQLPEYDIQVGEIEMTEDGIEITRPEERVTRDDG